MKSPRITSGALGQPGQWNALHDDAGASGSLLAHQQLGYYTLGTNPTNGQAISFVVNGTTITLTGKTGSISVAGDFAIQGSAAATLAVIINQLQNPWTTNSTQIALTLANQELLGYVGFSLVGTTITAYSLNTSLNSQLTSYSGSTTFSSGSWTAQTMQLYVEPGVFYINGGSQVKFAGGSTPTVTAPSSHPRIDVLAINSSGLLSWTTGTENASPTVPTYPVGLVPICELYNVVGETALYDNQNQQSGEGYIQADVRPFNNLIYQSMTGMMMVWPQKVAPSGYLSCDGSAISRSTYTALFAIIAPNFGNPTVTIASPGVFTLNSHGFVAETPVFLTTTGALPTGLSANTLYYVVSPTTNTFELSATEGGSAINTTGSQSGTHTVWSCPWGLGDGSTTFNLPDMRANVAGGYKSGDANFGYIGQTPGEATHLLTGPESGIQAHSHTIPLTSAASSTNTVGSTGNSSAGTGSTNSTGPTNAASAHNNIQPSVTVLWIIHT